MIKIGVVSNPRSQQNKKGTSPAERALAGQDDVLYRRIEDMAELPETLRDLARREVGLLAVSGGDGTVQGVLTELFEGRPFERPPPLAILPRGMTNMIAADVGVTRPLERGLKRLLELARAGDLDGVLAERHLIRADNIDGGTAQYGMFFGCACICRAIEACRRHVHSRGIESDAAAGVTLAALLAGWFLGRRGQNDVLHGDRIGVAVDNEEETISDHLLILVTTLDRLILRSRPYWNQNGASLRYTSIAYPPPRLARSLLRVLYGGPQRELPQPGYDSRGGERVSLSLSGPFTLDGQIYHPANGGPVVLTGAQTARFARC